jgi:hypothetical protein
MSARWWVHDGFAMSQVTAMVGERVAEDVEAAAVAEEDAGPAGRPDGSKAAGSWLAARRCWTACGHRCGSRWIPLAPRSAMESAIRNPPSDICKQHMHDVGANQQGASVLPWLLADRRTTRSADCFLHRANRRATRLSALQPCSTLAAGTAAYLDFVTFDVARSTHDAVTARQSLPLRPRSANGSIVLTIRWSSAAHAREACEAS